MKILKYYGDEYQSAVEYGISKLPEGEQFQVILFCTEEYTLFKKILLQYLFGWMSRFLSKQPRIYEIICSDQSAVFVGFKRSRPTISYEPEFFFVRPLSAVKVTKGHRNYSLYTPDEQNKKLLLSIITHNDSKKNLDNLFSLLNL